MIFFPKADAVLLSSHHKPPPPRPQNVEPIYDPESLGTPVKPWSQEVETLYPPKDDPFAPAAIPPKPEHCEDRYLRAFLAKDERLRLSMLWYYTRDLAEETEFLSGLQQKVQLAHETSEWDCAIIGILDVNFYVRLATVGTPIGILPRGETICAHTITQPPGSVFLLPNMLEDWRFQESPYVEHGGLRAYAGSPLRLQNEAGECVSLGSLCVASTTAREPLTKSQQHTLIHLADWVVSDIVQCTRARRQRQRRRMAEMLSTVQASETVSESQVFDMLKAIYPEAAISLRSCEAGSIHVDDRGPIPLSDFENGLWEDNEYLDDFIADRNNCALPRDRIVRIITARCESRPGLSLLAVASRDFQLIFDDVDLWFVQMCANLLSQIWHKLLLTDAIKAKEKFLRGFSHQLRTPLHGILGSVELLAEELMAREILLKATTEASGPSVYLDTIKRSGRDLISIVNSIITLNRWADIAMQDRSHATHTIRELEVALANDTLQAMSGDSRYRASIIFSHEPKAGDLGLRTDHTLLRDSLLPLILNAVQNTDRGSVTITTSMDPATRNLVVDVEDTGSGIAPEDQQRIFEPYERVHLHSAGAGLGLTLASKFATLLGGSVVLVSSQLGHGSHFRVITQAVQWEGLPDTPEQPPRFENLPLSFHICDGADVSSHFIAHLERYGLVSSDTVEGCLIIMTEGQHHSQQVPPGQVGLCWISALDGNQEEVSDNIVYLRGPVTTHSMASALAKAGQLLSTLDSVKQLTPLISNLQLDLVTSETSKVPNATEQVDLHGDVQAPPPSSQAAPAITVPLETTSSRSGPKPKALLVDDNKINLRIMEMYCTKRGLPYCSATNGQEAVELFTQHQLEATEGNGSMFQLILMDLQMPVCDGLEATRQIRRLEESYNWTRSNLFIVTGQDDTSDRGAAADAGADEYFVKPLAMKTLDQAINRIFGV